MPFKVFFSSNNSSRILDELKTNPLIAAIQRGRDLNAIIEIVETHIKALDNNHNSCLHYAVKKYKNDLSDIELLLKYRASTNAQNNKGDTPLHLATRNPNCNVNLIRVLLDNNGDPNVQNRQKETPLHTMVKAIRSKPDNNAEVVKLLLDQNADPNIPNHKGITPMTAAFGYNPIDQIINWNSISELIDHGADMNYTFACRSILYIAMYRNADPRIINKIIHHNPNLVEEEYCCGTALHKAVKCNFPIDVIKTLLYHGSDINAKNNRLDTPLHLAAYFASTSILKILINNGADINAKNKYGKTPLIEAMRSKGPFKLQIIKMLLDNGADINVKNNKDRSAMFYATLFYERDENFDVIKLLLEGGADPNGISRFKWWPSYQCRNLLLLKSIIPFLTLWNFLDEEERPERSPESRCLNAVNFQNCPRIDICIYISNLFISCISELMEMKNDKINEHHSLYQYVFDNCTNSKHFTEYPDEIVGEILSRENKYPHCKDLLMASLKRNKLIKYLSCLKVYTNHELSTVLEYHDINYLGNYLCKSTLINMIKVFS